MGKVSIYLLQPNIQLIPISEGIRTSIILENINPKEITKLLRALIPVAEALDKYMQQGHRRDICKAFICQSAVYLLTLQFRGDKTDTLNKEQKRDCLTKLCRSIESGKEKALCRLATPLQPFSFSLTTVIRVDWRV